MKGIKDGTIPMETYNECLNNFVERQLSLGIYTFSYK